jgi:hypothetical protein
MAKKKGPKIPKKIMGFKLSKGTRKDVRKLLKMVGDPDRKELAISAAGGLAAFLAERMAEHKLDKQAGQARAH